MVEPAVDHAAHPCGQHPAAGAAGRRGVLSRRVSQAAALRTLQARPDRGADHRRGARRRDPPAAGGAADPDRQGTVDAAAHVRCRGQSLGRQFRPRRARLRIRRYRRRPVFRRFRAGTRPGGGLGCRRRTDPGLYRARIDQCRRLARTQACPRGRHFADPATRLGRRVAGDQCRRAGRHQWRHAADHPQRGRYHPSGAQRAHDSGDRSTAGAAGFDPAVALHGADHRPAVAHARQRGDPRAAGARARRRSAAPARTQRRDRTARARSVGHDQRAAPADRRGRAFRRRCRARDQEPARQPAQRARIARQGRRSRAAQTAYRDRRARRQADRPAGLGNLRGEPDRCRIVTRHVRADRSRGAGSQHRRRTREPRRERRAGGRSAPAANGRTGHG